MMDPHLNGPHMEAREVPGRFVVELPRKGEVEELDEKDRVYGSRWVKVEDAGGAVRFEEVPLTWEDLFDPREGDRLVHSPDHGKTLRDAAAAGACRSQNGGWGWRTGGIGGG